MTAHRTDASHQRTALVNSTMNFIRWCGALHPVNVIGCVPAGDEPNLVRTTMSMHRTARPTP